MVCVLNAQLATVSGQSFIDDDGATDVIDASPSSDHFPSTDPDAIFNGTGNNGSLPPSNPETTFSKTHSVLGHEKKIDGATNGDEGASSFSFHALAATPYTNYRYRDGGIAWLPGSGEDFGWVSFLDSIYEERGETWGFTTLFNWHLLGGPQSSPIPPRLYDFAIGLQVRKTLSNQFSYDVATSIGAYSDFEGSAREGVRYVSHAVGMFHIDESSDFVFGVDYLDRDDIALLPVVGLSLRNASMPNVRFDLIFPRPRIDYALSDEWQIYTTARLDGGTWDIELPGGAETVMTYRDIRLLFGVERATLGNMVSGWELGYVFARRLEFRGGPGTSSFDDAFVLQWFMRQ